MHSTPAGHCTGRAGLFASIALAALMSASALAQPPATTSPITLEDQVRAELRPPFHDTSEEGAAAEDAFLARAADRVIRSSYQQRYHVVVRDAGFNGRVATPTTAPASLPQIAPAVAADRLRAKRNVILFIVPAILAICLVAAVSVRRRTARSESSPRAEKQRNRRRKRSR